MGMRIFDSANEIRALERMARLLSFTRQYMTLVKEGIETDYHLFCWGYDEDKDEWMVQLSNPYDGLDYRFIRRASEPETVVEEVVNGYEVIDRDVIDAQGYFDEEVEEWETNS